MAGGYRGGTGASGLSCRGRPLRVAVPGQLLHMDTKRFGRLQTPGHALTGNRRQRSRRIGWKFVHSIVDDWSKLAYAEIHNATVAGITRLVLDWFLAHGSSPSDS